MAVRMDKPWRALTAENVEAVGGHLGVYQLADAAQRILYIGVAGGRTLFGLKGELGHVLEAPPEGASQFRVEVTMSYRTRHFELLQAYRSDHGGLPPANTDVDVAILGRLRLD